MEDTAADLLERDQLSEKSSDKVETVGTKQSKTTPALGQGEIDQLWDQLRAKDAHLLMLQKKLGHFRAWLSSVHAKVQQMNPQAIKNSRRLYVGGIPADTSDEELRHFFNQLMMRTGALVSPGSAILSCKITQEKNYAFVEFRSVEEASNAMMFDGVAFKDTYLKIRRPSNYDPNTAIMLGPVLADPTMDTSSLEICKTVVEDSPHKLFIGGLPCDWNEDQVKEMLGPFGNLKSFNLVMDKVTGKSKGYAFCEYVEENVTDYVIKSLHGKKLGNKMLTVKRALEGSRHPGMTPLDSGYPPAMHGGAAYLQGYHQGGAAHSGALALPTGYLAPGASTYLGSNNGGGAVGNYHSPSRALHSRTTSPGVGYNGPPLGGSNVPPPPPDLKLGAGNGGVNGFPTPSLPPGMMAGVTTLWG